MKTAAYILNSVPKKSVQKTHFALWTRGKPTLNHFHVLGCPIKVSIYILVEKKTDPIIVSASLGIRRGLNGTYFVVPQEEIK